MYTEFNNEKLNLDIRYGENKLNNELYMSGNIKNYEIDYKNPLSISFEDTKGDKIIIKWNIDTLTNSYTATINGEDIILKPPIDFLTTADKLSIDYKRLKNYTRGEQTDEKSKDIVSSAGCKLTSFLKNVTIIPIKESASDSIIGFGDISIGDKSKVYDLRFISVALKIVFEELSIFNNSLRVERQIYKHVTEPLLADGNTPHLSSYIGTLEKCDTREFMSGLSIINTKHFDDALGRIKKIKFNIEKTSILVTGKSSGLTVGGLFDRVGKVPKTPFLAPVDIYNIVFQLLYTLKCFENVRLVHNDLHANNMFVEELENPEVRTYHISEDESVTIPIKYDIKIFDFDRGVSSHPDVERNFNLDETFCSRGMCNKFNPREDLAAVISVFMLECGDPYYKNYFNSVNTFLESLTKNKKFLLSMKDRPYPQVNGYNGNPSKQNEGLRLPDITERDLYSIDECISRLTRVPEFNCYMNSGKLTQATHTYRLPSKIDPPGMWNPISTFSHSPMNSSKKNTGIFTGIFTSIFTGGKTIDLSSDIVRKGVFNDAIKKYIQQDNPYYVEFGKDTLERSSLVLFKEYMNIKNYKLLESHLDMCVIALFILSIPFTYRFNPTEMKEFVESPIFLHKKYEWTKVAGKLEGVYVSLIHGSEYVNILVSIISDIWSVFKGTLPIKNIRM
jgi:hypothetical protein